MEFLLEKKTKKIDCNKQFLVQSTLRNKVLLLGHEGTMSGHLGQKKTYARITAHFYWPGISRDVKALCSSRDSCQKKNIPKGRVSSVPLGKNAHY